MGNLVGLSQVDNFSSASGGADQSDEMPPYMSNPVGKIQLDCPPCKCPIINPFELKRGDPELPGSVIPKFVMWV